MFAPLAAPSPCVRSLFTPLWLRAGNYSGAVQEFTSAIMAHEHPVADFFAHRADAYMCLGPAFVTEARADVRATLERAPGHPVRVKFPHLV
jgi:hypothetical protein